jgi:Flp pilus assembly protein TadD
VAIEPPPSPPEDDGAARQFSPSELLFARHLQQGYALFRAGRFADSLEELITASKIDPNVPDPYHYMGEIYRNLLLMDKAEQSYRKALTVNPKYTLSRKNLALVLYEAGRYDEATQILTELIKERPKDTFVIGELAINAIALGKPDEAIDLLEQYNAIEGDQAWGYTHLGRAHADAGHYERAEQAYRHALSLAPNFSLAHYWLGQLLAATGREEASKGPLARYYRLRRLGDEAHQWKMALLRNPDDRKALVQLARLRLNLGQPKESLALLQRALRLAPNDPSLIKLYRQVSDVVNQRSKGP